MIQRHFPPALGAISAQSTEERSPKVSTTHFYSIIMDLQWRYTLATLGNVYQKECNRMHYKYTSRCYCLSWMNENRPGERMRMFGFGQPCVVLDLLCIEVSLSICLKEVQRLSGKVLTSENEIPPNRSFFIVLLAYVCLN